MAIEKITDYKERALDRLLLQFKDKPNFESILTIFSEQIQELETIFCQLIEQRNLNTATGQTLDLMGTIVGQDRLGFDDTFYQSLLKAKVGENTSEGDIDKIITIVQFLTGANLVDLQEWFPLAIGIGIDTELDPDLINFLYERLNAVDVGGARLEQIWCFDPQEGFAFDGNQTNALGFGDINDSNEGGLFAGIHLKDKPDFAFASESGVDSGDKGFSSIEDVYVGGFLNGL